MGNAHRPGLSLTEVLLAIFVMGIGMIALLVLFPIGALNMASALRDSRFSLVCQNAEAQAEMVRIDAVTGQLYTIRTDALIIGALRDNTFGGLQATTLPYASTNPFYYPLGPPYPPAPPNPYWPWMFDVNTQGPPVLIDPQGYSLWGHRTIGTGANDQYVDVTLRNGALTRSYGIRRSAVSFAIPPAVPPGLAGISLVRRTFTIEDELSFEPNGQVRRTPTGLVERERKNSWAYMWRRPRFSEVKVADLAIVIFQGRQIEGSGSGIGNPPEPYFKGYYQDPMSGVVSDLAFAAGSTTARLRFNSTAWMTVPVKVGDWVLDATVIPPNPVLPPYAIPPHFNGYFYKVVGVGDPVLIAGNDFYQEIELARPAIADGYVGVMITGVAEVVEKNDGKMPPG